MPTANPRVYKMIISSRLKRILGSLKRKKPSLFRDVQKQIEKIVKEPEFGKLLKNVLKNQRRVHVGSFVLIYEIHDELVHLMDFDHHDRIYKKY